MILATPVGFTRVASLAGPALVPVLGNILVKAPPTGTFSPVAAAVRLFLGGWDLLRLITGFGNRLAFFTTREG